MKNFNHLKTFENYNNMDEIKNKLSIIPSLIKENKLVFVNTEVGRGYYYNLTKILEEANLSYMSIRCSHADYLNNIDILFSSDVLILEEFDKCPPKIHDILLNEIIEKNKPVILTGKYENIEGTLDSVILNKLIII